MNVLRSILAISLLAATMAIASAAETDGVAREPTPAQITSEDLTGATYVQGTCEGLFVPFRMFDGYVYGDMTGRETSVFQSYWDPFLHIIWLEGRTTVSTTCDAMYIEDLVMLVPTGDPGLLHWVGSHDVVGGVGCWENVYGHKVTDGLLDLETGELFFTYEGYIWLAGPFGR